MSGPQLHLLDIEGTTTPIAFVTDVLFPFARKRLRTFLETHAGEPEVEAQLAALERDHARESPEPPPRWDPADRLGSACAYLEWQMDRDRKATPLKALQGMIWEDGYRAGALVSVVYDDVRPAFERWRAAERAIAIFSSGSVLAQKLLFAHTSAGDLTPYLSGYFDTTSGPKQEPESYARIATDLGRSPEDVVFVSDVVPELDAARVAGMRTVLALRPGNAPATGTTHRSIASFAELE